MGVKLQLHYVMQHATDLHGPAIADPVKDEMSGSRDVGVPSAVPQMVGADMIAEFRPRRTADPLPIRQLHYKHRR
jgi:hypothetical protein